MKSKFSVLGIITLVIVIGFVLFSCGGGAGSSNPPPREPIISPNVGKLVPIPAGTFTMGQSDIDDDAMPHSVTLSAFYMSEYELTQAQWEKVMGIGTDPSNFSGDDLPVETVRWYEAIVFCNKLSVKEGLTPAYYLGTAGNTDLSVWGEIPDFTGHANYAIWNDPSTGIKCDFDATGYRLPTEAEWEYACRAGTTDAYNTGNTITTSQANFINSVGKTTVVGTYPANAYGLYDMHGNVWELCWDWYKSNYYEESPSTDPTGASSGERRVFRGGGWITLVGGLRSATRNNLVPSAKYDYIGFRLVRP
ncbi:MAG: formylglycine-generating enzyme family protein [Treponema sp.]|jgi:formylglycine-generating enzyme required for sulfatase activity|nr:formylglycine-generating enzyme family protein [Treponema sp.]